MVSIFFHTVYILCVVGTTVLIKKTINVTYLFNILFYITDVLIKKNPFYLLMNYRFFMVYCNIEGKIYFNNRAC